MNRSWMRSSMAAALAVVVIVIALSGSFSSASAARRHPTPTVPVVPTNTVGASWTLIDNHQSTCYFFPQQTTDTNYYGVWIQGTWAHAITVGASNLPAGAVWYTFSSPIPPGSSNGIGGLADVAVQIPNTTPLGTYTAKLWANDGKVTESVPITLKVQSDCGGY